MVIDVTNIVIIGGNPRNKAQKVILRLEAECGAGWHQVGRASGSSSGRCGSQRPALVLPAAGTQKQTNVGVGHPLSGWQPSKRHQRQLRPELTSHPR